jgi:anaerobic magnesium-protoporphyrin IX monomethyl ester cyclase
MKNIFINPYSYYASGTNEATVYPPLGLCYIASVLEKNGFESKIIDANVLKMENEKIIDIISSYNPDLVGIYTNIVSARAAIELGKMIKEFNSKITTVAGGPLATTLPEKFASVFDIVVRGEGELTLLEFNKHMKLKGIDGITFSCNGKIFHNKNRNLIENLDTIPFPAFHLLEPNLKKYKCRARKKPVAPILTSRGCPYQCIYCNKSIFGHSFRARSPENVMSEIQHLVDNYKIKQIDILDDNFTLDPRRAEVICDMIIERGYNIAINCQNGVRADRLSEELVGKMKKAGVFKVGIGIESGDKDILKIMKKQLDLEKVKEAIRMFRKNGITTYGFFIFGLPGDTPASMQRTIDFAKEANPTIANFCIAIPFPGTEMFEIVKREGRFLQNMEDGIFSGFYDGEIFFETKETKKEDVIEFYKKAYKEFYFRPGKIMDIVSSARSLGEVSWMLEAAISTSRSVK